MPSSVKYVVTSVCIGAIIFGLLTAKSLIDHRQQITMAAYAGSSPQFSGEELTNELPQGLHWELIDRDGYAFDWDAFCQSHVNCMEAFRAQGIPFPKIEGPGYAPEDMAAYYDRMAEDLYQDQADREQDAFDSAIEQATYCERDREECPVQCTTDTDCRLKFGGDGGPSPRRK